MKSENDERRLVMRMLGHWRSLTGRSDAPRRSQIDPQKFGRDWANCVLIDLGETLEEARYAYVGRNLVDSRWPTFERQCVADCAKGGILRFLTGEVPKVISRRGPAIFGGLAEHEEIPVLYRAILTPISENGIDVDGILGAANYREFAPEQKLTFFDDLAIDDDRHDRGNGGLMGYNGA
jgi:hypothetical protein